MTEKDWLSSIDPVPMMRFLMLLYHSKSDRKFRLFVCACWMRYRSDLEHLPAIAEEVSVYGHDGANIPNPFSMAESWASVQLASAELEQWDKAGLIREIFNPFCPFPESYHQAATPQEADNVLSLLKWRQWRNRLIVTTAEDIYNSCRFEDMPILADMLEDAGCQEEAILRHCRGQKPCWQHPEDDSDGCTYCEEGWVEDWWGRSRSPALPLHVRGCWVLDLILGRS